MSHFLPPAALPGFHGWPMYTIPHITPPHFALMPPRLSAANPGQDTDTSTDGSVSASVEVEDTATSDVGHSVSTATPDNFDVFTVAVWEPEKKTGGKITIKRRTVTAVSYIVTDQIIRKIYRRYDPLLKLTPTHRMEVRDVSRETGLATSLISAIPHFDTPTQYALNALLAIHGLKETQEPHTLNPLLAGDAVGCACCTTALSEEAAGNGNDGHPCEYTRHLPDGTKCGATMEDETGKYWTCTTDAQGLGLFIEEIAGQKKVTFFCMLHYERALKHRMCPCATFMTASKRKTKNYRFQQCDKGHLYHAACAPVCPHDGH